MIVIRDPNLVPPGGGFRWVCADEPCASAAIPVEFKHHTVPFIFEQARQHAASNGHEFTNEKFTANVCANAYPGTCHEVDGAGVPSMIERVKNATKAVINHGRHGFKMSGEELYGHRHAICVACPYWGGDTGGTWFAIACKKCGCTGVKLKWQSETCPIGAW